MDEARRIEALVAERAVKSISDAIEAFGAYLRWLNSNHPQLLDQATDAQKRLKQAKLVLTRVNTLLAESREASAFCDVDLGIQERDGVDAAITEWRVRTDNGAKMVEAMKDSDWIELLTEQFYWVSFRARSAIRHLPLLEQFEAIGVRNNRNQLIEHTEGKLSRIFNGGFGFGAEQGPVLACMRLDSASKSWSDAGLFVNVEEFSQGLIAAIERAIRTEGK